MLQAGGFPKKLWAEAINTACHVINRTGPSAIARKSPIEVWLRKGPAAINHFQAFGSECYVHVPKQRRQKWSPKAVKGILVGYCGKKNGYRVRIGDIKSCNVVFRYNENNVQSIKDIQEENSSSKLSTIHRDEEISEKPDAERANNADKEQRRHVKC